MASDYIEIGEIVKPQGIRGEVKLRAGSPERCAKLETVYLKEGGAYRPRRVLKGRSYDGFAFLQLEGVGDRNAAEALRGQAVYIDREHGYELGEDENFISDLIGLTAVDTQGNRIGRLRDVLSPNAVCDVYVFDTPRGELMIPALKRVVNRVDLEAGQIVLDERVLPEVAVWQDEPAERDE